MMFLVSKATGISFREFLRITGNCHVLNSRLEFREIYEIPAGIAGNL